MSGIYQFKRCSQKNRQCDFTPMLHQLNTRDKFLESSNKGMLLFHRVGSGKTCTTIMIADELLKRQLVKKVIIFCNGALRNVWIDEYCNLCGCNSDYLTAYYIFVTMNYPVDLTYLKFENTLVIVDECHILINGVKNFSSTATKFYNTLANSDCRILLLSGTPLMKDWSELALIFHLICPDKFRDYRHIDTKVVDDDQIKTLFSKSGDFYIPKNPSYVENLFNGLISYHPGGGVDTPTRIDHIPIIVSMTAEQSKECKIAISVENALIGVGISEKLAPSPDGEHNNYAISYLRVKSRGISNVYYLDPEQRRLPDEYAPKGWLTDEYVRSGKLYNNSPKFMAVLKNILKHLGSKQIVYSYFKKKSGVILLKNLLQHCGINCLLFSGDEDANQKNAILNKFNQIDNIYGQLYPILFITNAGREGITVKCVQHVHILESDTKYKNTEQVIARAIRHQSHIQLPEEERVVNVWRYWSVMTNDNAEHLRAGIDGYLYHTSKDISEKNDQLTTLLATYSV